MERAGERLKGNEKKKRKGKKIHTDRCSIITQEITSHAGEYKNDSAMVFVKRKCYFLFYSFRTAIKE